MCVVDVLVIRAFALYPYLDVLVLLLDGVRVASLRLLVHLLILDCLNNGARHGDLVELRIVD